MKKYFIVLFLFVALMFTTVSAVGATLFHDGFEGVAEGDTPVANTGMWVFQSPDSNITGIGAAVSGANKPRRHDLNDGQWWRHGANDATAVLAVNGEKAGMVISFDAHSFTSGTSGRRCDISAVAPDGTQLMSFGIDMQSQIFANGEYLTGETWAGLQWTNVVIVLHANDWEVTVGEYEPHGPSSGASVTITDAPGSPTGPTSTFTGLPYKNEGAVVSEIFFDPDAVHSSDTLIFCDNVLVEGNPILVRINETEGNTEVAEGGFSDTIEVELIVDPNEANPNRFPTAPVVVTLTPDLQTLVDGSAQAIIVSFPVTTDPNGLVWTVTVSAADDEDNEGPHTGLITAVATSADSRYDGMPIADVVVDIVDDDGTPGVVLSKTEALVREGGATDSYTIVLGTPPSSPVTIDIASDGQVEDPNSIVFDSTNWATPQTVEVIAVDDLDVEGTPHASLLTHTVITDDVVYGGMAVDSVSVSIADNDSTGPASVAPYAWYMADFGAMNGEVPVADGENITQWLDQSPNYRNLTNLSSGYQGPTYVAQYGPTNAGTLSFGQNQHIWQGRGTWGDRVPYPMTIFLVGTFGQAGHMHFLASSSGTGDFRYGQTSTGRFELNTTASPVWQPADSQTGKRTLSTAVFSTTDSKLLVNGLLFGEGQALTADNGGMSGLMVGSFGTDFRGEIAEIMFYNADLSDEDRQAVEQYLLEKYMDKVFVYETANSTQVAEADGVTEDTFDIQLLGVPGASVDVLLTPEGPNAGDIDLGEGPGNAKLLNFTGAGATTVTVTSLDNTTSDGPRDVKVAITTTSTDPAYDQLATEFFITVTDNEVWCGQPGTVYHQGDVNKDCYVNLGDVAEMAGVWLECTHPFYTQDCIQELE